MDKKVSEVIRDIKKSFGEESISILGSMEIDLNLQAVSTGVLSVDTAIGIGGLPRGRIIEIYGKESSGKSTFAQHFVSVSQAKGLTCAYIDAEQAFDPVYATAIGVDLKKLIFSQPDSGEQALGIVEALLEADCDIIIIDSVAALVPEAELKGELGQPSVAIQARLMSASLRRLSVSLKDHKSVIVFINQLRDNIGVMWGDTEITPGGRALKFYASVRIELKKSSSIKDGDEIIGFKVKARVVKSKVSPPLKEGEMDILFGFGIDELPSLVELAIENKIIDSKPPWYEYPEKFKVIGKQKVYQELRKNPNLINTLRESLLSVFNTKNQQVKDITDSSVGSEE